MSDLPAPPYPADTRAKGWRFELDYERIDQSTTWSRTKPEARPWLLMLWLVAWKQVPCGSLPDDEEAIAGAMGAPDELWAAHKTALLRGWWKASDGRLYHDTLTERVLAMVDTRGSDRTRAEARRKLFDQIRERDGNACVYCGHTKYLTLDHLMPVSRGGDNDERNLAAACRPCNSKKRDRTPEEADMPIANPATAARWDGYKKSGGLNRTHADARGTPADSGGSTQRNDTGTGTSTSLQQDKPVVEGAKRATRKCPRTFEVTDAMVGWAAERGYSAALVEAETEKFRDHTFKTAISDWPGAWRNWIRKAAEFRAVPGARVVPLNRQEAIEQRNRQVGDDWLAEQEALDATR